MALSGPINRDSTITPRKLWRVTLLTLKPVTSIQYAPTRYHPVGCSMWPMSMVYASWSGYLQSYTQFSWTTESVPAKPWTGYVKMYAHALTIQLCWATLWATKFKLPLCVGLVTERWNAFFIVSTKRLRLKTQVHSSPTLITPRQSIYSFLLLISFASTFI